MNIRQRWKQTSLPNKLLVATGLLVAFGTLFYAVAAAFQVCLMKEGAKQSAAQVERLVGSTNAAITKAVDQERESVQSTLRQNRVALDAALSQAKASLDASNKQSNAALYASIDNSHLDQRAWIGVEMIESHPPTIKVDDAAYITFAFKNTGKTPALDVRSTITKDPVERGAAPNFTYTGERIARYGTLPPNGSAHVTLSVANSLSTGELRPITPQVLNILVAKTTIYYIHGFVLYADIFGTSHWITVCYFAHNFPGPISFGACGEHNDTGDGREPVYVPSATKIEWPPHE